MRDFLPFEEHFVPTSKSTGASVSIESAKPEINQFLAKFSGCSFNHGLYRIHTAESAHLLAPQIAEGFPSYSTMTCFAFDWLGRQFVTSNANQGPIYLLEPGSGEAFEIPVGFTEFHDLELVDYQEAALASVGFSEWLNDSAEEELTFADCVGYETPLFLGGADDATNYELINTDVYWTVSAALIDGLRNSRPGTNLSGIEITDLA